MPSRSYNVIKHDKIAWVWKHRSKLFSHLLLHRKDACLIEEAPSDLYAKALKINVLAFRTLLIDYTLGLIQLSQTTSALPTTLVLGRGASSIVKIALLIENQKAGQSLRRVAFRMPFFKEDGKTGYKPGAYKTNETQKSLYDHPNIETNALFIGELHDPKAPCPLEFTIEEIWQQAHTYNARNKSAHQAVDVLEIVLGMAKGLEYLHSYNLVHRDVKPWNVLVKKNNDGHLDVQLADVETIYPASEHKVPMRGTPGFVAPEIKESVEKKEGITMGLPTFANDLYALGQSILYFRFILLQRAFAKAHKYPERMHDMMRLKIRTTVDRRPLSKKSFKSLMARLNNNGGFEGYEYLELILKTLEDLARRLCDEDPEKRPSAHEVVDLLQSLAEVTEFKPTHQAGESYG